MYDDLFTQVMRIVCYIGASAILAFCLAVSIWGRKPPPRPELRPWDWTIDGECENASHPRVLP